MDVVTKKLGNRTMMMGPAPDTSANSRRTIAFVVILGVHAVLLFLLNAGLTVNLTEKIFGPIKTEIIDEVKKEEDKPPPPPPKIETPPPFVPPPDISIEVVPVENTTAIQVVTQTRPVEAPPPVVRKAVRTAPGYDKKKSYSLPDYPPAELRAGHEGTVYLELYVQVDGHIGEARIKTSSGFPRLDEAAVDHVRRTYRLVPAMEDGKPIADWVTLPVVFRINK